MLKRRKKRIRLGLPFILVFLSLAILEARLYHLQILHHREFAEQAQREQVRAVEVSPQRGKIYDRNLEKLAINIPCYSLYARPQEIPYPERLAQRLSPLLEMEASEIAGKLKKERIFLWLKRGLSLSQKERIQGLGLPGIDFIEGSKRFYPQGQLASHLLGLVGVDNQGLAGVEFSYHNELQGKKGYFQIKEDALGYEIPLTKRMLQALIPGKDVILTIDSVIQSIVEKEIFLAFQRTGAKSVEVLFMDPQTGEILALANQPSYDPNHYSRYPLSARRNRIVQSLYEPGSTFKAITASALLEENLVDLKDRIYCSQSLPVADHLFHDWKEFNEKLSFTQIIQDSSDIGMIKAARRMREEVFYRYIHLFGFGSKTGVDLPGEERGIVRSVSSWSATDFPCIAIGQGLAVTPLQMVTALCALINGGKLLRPYLVKYVCSPEGEIVKENLPLIRRRVISPATSQKMIRLLGRVVEQGTGIKAGVRGYSVGGKTGTAQIPASHKRGYLEDKYIASFMGFAPLDFPRIVGIVIIKEPVGVYWGGTIAAPLFARIMRKILPYLNVLPEKVEWIEVKEERLSSPGGLKKDISPSPLPAMVSKALNILSSLKRLKIIYLIQEWLS